MENAQASLLDRLIDENPGQSNEPVQYRLLTVKRLRAFVVRDLENLLNSRRNVAVVPSECHETSRSVLTYGLKDFTTRSPDSTQALTEIRKEVEKTISIFEPRLKNVKVAFETSNEHERRLSFRISAILVVDPIREPVTFDTYFDSARKEYVISS
ncbi:hypothetical protein DSCO28_20790 [Desulfosarcina ovata subsp. sediminis]|uniref:IraD/Gp25-like domain-containing protein n=1 Tax=Desulfosarcina ovata subsp. sediminis TaxID=885957 RepID=A0A5K7ZRG2_9BACT|nr:type VI secretion system baseplate subunit TssE [Desulfosarcina ovata]BBO81513.1 hypothetical protein DSCO28_20790 [Desulfosarcina ovata subsp. sediminis]